MLVRLNLGTSSSSPEGSEKVSEIVQYVPVGDHVDGYRRSADRERRTSVSTHQTEKTERYELEESSEFLQPVDHGPNIMDELDYQVVNLLRESMESDPIQS